MGLYKYTRAIAALTVVGGVVASTSLAAYAATLSTASIALSDPRPSQSSTYTVTASGWTTGSTIGCIEVKFNTLATGAGAVPNTTTGATGSTQNIATGTWTVNAASNGTVRITTTTPVAPTDAGAHTITMPSITNGATANTSYYAFINTYPTNACSATAVDSTVVQFIYTDGQAASVSVDSQLSFSVAGATGTVNGATTNATATPTTIPFGTATTAANKIAAQTLTVTTNAGTGYSVFTRYTGQLNNGAGGTIADLSVGGASNTSPQTFTAAGTEGFGYTTEDITLGSGTANRFTGNKWAPFTTTNAEVAYNAAPIASDATKVGFQVGVAGTTKAGTYTSTVIYTATPIY